MGPWIKTEKLGGGVLHIPWVQTQKLQVIKYHAGVQSEIYDTDLIGATEGFKAATEHNMVKFAFYIAVCLDN